MRVVLADPPAFTPAYDHELAAALELATSHLRFGDVPAPDGYRRTELEPVDRYREQAGAPAEWRLGYRPQAEGDRAFGQATLALFPYRPAPDQSGALLRALGAGVPAVVYDVGWDAAAAAHLELYRELT